MSQKHNRDIVADNADLEPRSPSDDSRPTSDEAADDDIERYMHMPVWQAIVKNAGPAMAAMIMVLIYNLADTFFIGQTHDALLVAAVSYATPVFLIFMSVGTVFGIGGTSVISRALGEGRADRARRTSSFCMWACVGTALVMTVLALVFMDQVVALSGSTAEAWDATETYLTIVTFGGVFVIISNCFSNVIRAEGKPRTAMMGQVIGNALNVVLDPLFILGFGWGIAGAAIATVIGNVVAAGYYLAFYISGKSSLGVSIRNFAARDGIASGVLSIGIPASLGSLLMSLSQIVVNTLMAGYGDMAVAGIGVAMKITMITGMIAMGFAQGVQPLLGYCVGAGAWDRFKQFMRLGVVSAFALSTAMTLLCYAFCTQIVGVFLTQPDAVGYATEFTRILLTTSFLTGMFFMLTYALQAMGAAVEATVVNLSRQGFIYIPMLFVLESLMGVTGLVWAQPVADVLSLALVIGLFSFRYRRMVSDKTDRRAENSTGAFRSVAHADNHS